MNEPIIASKKKCAKIIKSEIFSLNPLLRYIDFNECNLGERTEVDVV